MISNLLTNGGCFVGVGRTGSCPENPEGLLCVSIRFLTCVLLPVGSMCSCVLRFSDYQSYAAMDLTHCTMVALLCLNSRNLCGAYPFAYSNDLVPLCWVTAVFIQVFVAATTTLYNQ